MGGAMAKPHGTYSVTPSSVTGGTPTGLDLSFLSAQGSSTGTNGDNLECLVFTLDSFTSLTGASATSPSGNWHAQVGPPPPGTTDPASNQVTLWTDDPVGAQLHKGETATAHVTATPPSSAGDVVFNLDTFRTNDCSNSGFLFSASTTVTVTSGPPPPPPAGKNNTTTTLVCATGTPVVNTPDNCTATVKDIGGSVAVNAPTGTVTLTTSGGGAWAAPGTCTLGSPTADSASCSLNYTPSATGGQTLTASYGGDSDHVGSVGTAGITVQSGTQPPGNFKPDELIRLLHAKTFKGNNIYNGTGGRQTVFAKARHRHSRTAIVEVQNDGDLDTIIVTGQGHRPGYSIKYFHGKTNITNDVVSRVYTLHLAHGAFSRIKVVITVLKGARVGLVRSWQIEARSQGDPTQRDVVKFKVGVLKG